MSPDGRLVAFVKDGEIFVSSGECRAFYFTSCTVLFVCLHAIDGIMSKLTVVPFLLVSVVLKEGCVQHSTVDSLSLAAGGKLV